MVLDYVVSLEDKMSAPSKAAAGSLENLTNKMLGAQKALGQVNPEPLGKKLKKTGEDSDSTLSKLLKTEQLGIVREAFAGAAAGVKEFAGSIKEGDLKGAVGGVTESLAGMAGLLDLIYPGLGQVASAVIKLTGGLLGLVVGLAQSGVEMAISATQGKQAMISMFDALGAGKITGEEVEGMLSDLSAQLGVTKDQLAPLTKNFLAMGITGKDALERITTAAISAEAITKGGADAFTTMTKKIEAAGQAGQALKIPVKGMGALFDMGLKVEDIAGKMGMSAKDLGDKMKEGLSPALAAKFGDAMQTALIEKGAKPLQRMGMSIDNMKKMFSQSIEDMFEDMGSAIEPFLKEIKSFFAVFSQANPSGRAMKVFIGGALTNIFSILTKIVPPIKHFFLDMIILSLKTYIFVKQHWSTVKNVFLALVIVMGILIAPVLAVVAVFAAAVAISLAVGAGIMWVIDALVGLGKAAFSAGADFVSGLVNGIKNGVGMVVDAAKALAGSAIGAVKGVLGIASPSKIMIGMGMNTADGMSAGIDAGASNVEASATAMGGAAAGGAAKGLSAGDFGKAGAATATPAGGGGESSMGPVTIQITAPSGVTNALELTELAVAALFERLMLQRGGGGQPA